MSREPGGFCVSRHSHEPACDVMMMTFSLILPALKSADETRRGPTEQMSIMSSSCAKLRWPSFSPTPTDSAGP